MKTRKVLFRILTAALAAVLAVCIWQIYRILSEYRRGSNSYDALEAYVSVPAETAATPQEAGESALPEQAKPAPAETEPAVAAPAVDFQALAAVNPEAVGWLLIPGTDINYPVAQSGDNAYYLTHLFSGETNSAGCLFLDCGNAPDFSDANSVIYGHNMKNGSMFGGLTGYKTQAFYDEHPTGWLVTPEGCWEVSFFAGYVAQSADSAWQRSFSSEEAFEDWLAAAVSRSCFQSGVTPGAGDRVLTLSTCSYEFNNARFVVMGMLSPVSEG